jgi:hypothetical protein
MLYILGEKFEWLLRESMTFSQRLKRIDGGRQNPQFAYEMSFGL